MYKNTKVLSLFLAILCFASTAIAQETTGNIEGTVKDQSGAVVPGATIKVTGVTRGYSRTLTADDEGNFILVQVPQGTYKVTTSNTGFADRTSTVEVALGQTSTLNIKLEAGGGTAVVDVTVDDVVAIDVENNKIQTNINARLTELTPKGNINFSGVLRVSPAVRPEPLSAGFQIDGSSGAENTYIVDGLEVTNFRTGQLLEVQNLSNDAVGEVQVKTSGFLAEYGGATGGVINVVSKGGDNQFRGAFGTQFEVSGLNAATRPILRNDSGALEYIRPGKPGSDFLNPPDTEFTNFFPSGRLSGPIIKNRFWFFGSVAPQFRTQERTNVFIDGTTETNRRELRNDYYFGRLDGQIGDTLHLTGTYSNSPEAETGTLLPFTAGGSTGDRSELGGRINAQSFTYSAAWTATSNLIITGRGGRVFLNEKDGSYGIGGGGSPAVECRGSQAVLDTIPNFGCTNGQLGDITPAIFNILRDVSTRDTFDIDAVYVVNGFGGRHIFKGGYQSNRLKNDVNQSFDGGLFRFFFGESSRGIGSPLGHATFTTFGTVGITSSENQAVFLQDSFQVGRLALNLGIRIERENIPSFSENGVEVLFGWGDKPTPRLGFAYDLFGDGKSKVFASWGWFHDRFKYELSRGLFGGDNFLRTFVPIVSTDINTYTEQSIRSDPAGLTLNFRIPSNSPDDNRVDPDLRPQRLTEFTVGFEREIFTDILFRARYTHKRLNRTIEDVGQFDDTGNELFFVTNPGNGFLSQPDGIPDTPAAERRYDAVEFRFDKRYANNYYFNASYTYSRLFGNYSGLASSDERGRSAPNVNRFFDLPYLGFDVLGNADNARLATDRPHAVKVFAGYTFDWMKSSTNSTDFTIAFVGQSGTPLSSQISLFDANTFLFGRGDLGRTDTFTQTDFAVTHRYRFGRDNKFGVAFEVNILNLFNQNAVTDRFTSISATSFAGQRTENNDEPDEVTFNFFPSACIGGNCDQLNTIRAIFSGGLQTELVNLLDNENVFNATDDLGNPQTFTESFVRDARYNQPQSFQQGRQVRFGFRFMF